MKYIRITVIILLIYSCKNKKEDFYGLKPQNIELKDVKELKINTENIRAINVPNIHKSTERIMLSKLIDSSFSISLETTKKNLIGKIDEIKIYKNTIYVVDIYKAKAVFRFDLEGNYLGRIGEKGNGPGEYSRPDGFEIDKKNNELLVSNTAKRKILRFDLKGNFLGDIKPNIGNIDFKVLDDGKIVLLAGDQENRHLGEISNKIVYIINNKGDIISYGPTVSSDYTNVKTILSGNNMVGNNGVISYCYKFSDTIYSINNDKLSADFVMNFADNSGLNRKVLKSMNTIGFFNTINKGKGSSSPTYFKGGHFQTKDYLYFIIKYKNKWFNFFYNKNQSKIIAGALVRDKPGYFFVSPFISSYNDYFISSHTADRLIDKEKEFLKSYPVVHRDMLKLLKSEEGIKLKYGDNPVLFFYRFKQKYD